MPSRRRRRLPCCSRSLIAPTPARLSLLQPFHLKMFFSNKNVVAQASSYGVASCACGRLAAVAGGLLWWCCLLPIADAQLCASPTSPHNRHMQIVRMADGHIVAAASTHEAAAKEALKAAGTSTSCKEAARAIGEALAQRAKVST